MNDEEKQELKLAISEVLNDTGAYNLIIEKIEEHTGLKMDGDDWFWHDLEYYGLNVPKSYIEE